MKIAAFAGLTVLAALIGCGSASASEDGFLARFKGSWSGSGTVQKNMETSPWRVSCEAIGNLGTNRIVVHGTCNASIVTRAIGADLIYNPKSGRYRGIYTGANVGPATLSGKRVGNQVDLTITWPQPVNGDTKARMTILNTGKGTLRITVADNLFPGGPIRATSRIYLKHA